MRILAGIGIVLFLLFIVLVGTSKPMTKEEQAYMEALRREAAREHAAKVEAAQQRIRQGR